MSSSDLLEWASALNKECLRFKDMKALAIVKPPKGARIPGTLTRLDYKEGTLPTASQKHLWHPVGGSQTTFIHLRLDREVQIPSSSQQENYLHVQLGQGLHSSLPICG